MSLIFLEYSLVIYDIKKYIIHLLFLPTSKLLKIIIPKTHRKMLTLLQKIWTVKNLKFSYSYNNQILNISSIK